MNFYIELINKSIDFIEENLFDNISLEAISKSFNLSQYHYDRLFNSIVGTSLKQYILGRKLTIASDKLVSTNDTIINIALDLGFQYPEVFSRAFKKYYGVSPSVFRAEKPQIERTNKAVVIPRDIINYNGGLALKAAYIFLDNVKLHGLSRVVNVAAADFEEELTQAGEEFFEITRGFRHLKHENFYNLVSCHGEESSLYTVYYGKEALDDAQNDELETRLIPASWYASFIYNGNMLELRTTFEGDLFKWIALKEIKLNPVGIGMISIYGRDYFENQQVRILVPVIGPQT